MVHACGIGRSSLVLGVARPIKRLFFCITRGLVQATEQFKQAGGEWGATRYEDHHMRMVMFFDTGAAKYAWLTESVFIAEGRIPGKNEIEYQIYRVT